MNFKRDFGEKINRAWWELLDALCYKKFLNFFPLKIRVFVYFYTESGFEPESGSKYQNIDKSILFCYLYRNKFPQIRRRIFLLILNDLFAPLSYF